MSSPVNEVSNRHKKNLRWFVLKNWMRQRWGDFDTFCDCVDAAFKECTNVYP